MTESVECVVIGAGVIGLAVARELAGAGLETIVLESGKLIGSGTSSRNSEVIHAGIYYPPKSLKARLCVSGKELLYEYCDSHGVKYDRCGKLIVATDDGQLEILEHIISNGADSGVTDLRLLDRHEALELEPELECAGAVISPSTGIIDSHGFMLALQGDLEREGGLIAFGSPVLSGRCTGEGVALSVGGEKEMKLHARNVVNCAGLYAQEFARRLENFPADCIPPIFYAKGNYYSLNCSSPFRRLIYPVPEKAGLGVHLTLDLGGSARFGPDVEWIDKISYEVDPLRSEVFYPEIRKYWPDLPDNSLSPGYAGIRPKLKGLGEGAGDFWIQGDDEHGVEGLVNLFGIESPGLTASLAIADYVRKLIAPH